MKTCTFPSPVGLLTAVEQDGFLTGLSFGGTAQSAPATALLRETQRQLNEYFAKERRSFSLPLSPQGTDFQRRVWTALCEIPYGQTRTYAQIAAAVGNGKASRAVGSANHVNPIAIIVPCHRVIGSDGKLTGYAGGLHVKQYLLALEQI